MEVQQHDTFCINKMETRKKIRAQMGFEPMSLRDLVSLAAVFWMTRNAPLKELSFGGALRHIRKMAARETIRDLVGFTQW